MPWRKRKLHLGTKRVLGIPQSGKDEWASEHISEWSKEWNNEKKWVELSVEPGPQDGADKRAGGWGWVRHRLRMLEPCPICSPGIRGVSPWGWGLSSPTFTELTVHWEDQWWNKRPLQTALPGIDAKELNAALKCLYVNIHINAHHNSQKVKTTQMLINCQMGKVNVACPYNGIRFHHQKELSTVTCYDFDEPPKHDAKWGQNGPQFHLYEISRIGKSIKTEIRQVVARGWAAGGGRNGEQLLNRYRVSFWGDKNVVELGRGDDGCTPLWAHWML